MEPRIQYAQTADGVNIAFWTRGEGVPLLQMPNLPWGHTGLESQWLDYRRFYERLAEKRKVVCYDGRGSGLSDRELIDFSPDAQSLAEVAVEALRGSCDNLTRGGLMDALEPIEDFHSDLLLDEVNITFSDTGHTALGNAKLLKVVLHDGKGEWEYFGPLLYYGQEE